MLRVLEQIGRMRGGAQSDLMRCDNGNDYVVKSQNKRQHRRVRGFPASPHCNSARAIRSSRAASRCTVFFDRIPLHRFVRDTLRDAGVEPVRLDHFAVWVVKLKPMMQ